MDPFDTTPNAPQHGKPATDAACALVARGHRLHLLAVKDSPGTAGEMLLTLRQGILDPVWERDALAAGPWDAVLSAYSLSGFGAPAALKLVRAADPDLPFLVVSGAVGEDVAVEMMRSRASDYVLKHDLARLAPAVEREVREAASRRAARAADQAAAHLAAVVALVFGIQTRLSPRLVPICAPS